MNSKEAMMLGIILGDGSFGVYGKNVYSIRISCHSIDDKKFLRSVVSPLMKRVFGKEPKEYDRKATRTTDLIIYSRKAYEQMLSMYGLQKSNKWVRIPTRFADDSVAMKGITAGLLATDGSVVLTNNNGTVYPRVEIQNKSSGILREIRSFLTSKGMNAGLYTRPREEYDSTITRLQLNGRKNLLKFNRMIGFINPKHQLKFVKYMQEVGVE
jgi:hypothetical protein